MDVLALMANRYQSLSPSERRVADFIQRHVDQIVLMPLQVLASKCDTSDATVLRLCRNLGFSGYQDFKSALIPQLLRQGMQLHAGLQQAPEEKQPDNAALALARSLNDMIRSSLLNVDSQALQKAATCIVAAQTVVTIGLAGSAGVARIFTDSLLSIEKKAYCLSDRVEIERLTPCLAKDDVLIGISHSGDTEEVCLAMEKAGDRVAATIGITNFSPSRLQQAAGIVLLTSIPETLLGSYSCISRIVQLALLELLLTYIVPR